MVGRYSDINNVKEVSKLEEGMDFRLPENRREVFLKFYEFHTKYKGHAGAVYYVFPYLFKTLKMTMEQKLWLVFINGCSQHPVTTYLIYQKFPDFNNLDIPALKEWFYANYKELGWDTDRRYFKNSFIQSIESYKKNIGNQTQEEFFNSVGNTDNEFTNFDLIWDKVLNGFAYFGRLSTFSYLEYVRLAGINLNCSKLFLDDIKGSKSHRNGICKVIGRDDWDWTKQNEMKYSEEMIAYLSSEGEQLLAEAKARFDGPNVNYFTLETTLCCFKGWFRTNRRYPNVYNDMFHDRILNSEQRMGIKLPIFWDARKEFLPEYLRLEDNHSDIGFCKEKQNHFRLTGEVIMMDQMFNEFSNNLKKK